MERKIKKVKDFLKDGPPQFDVILRRGKGEPMKISIHSQSKELKMDYTEMIYPQPEGEGLIKIAKRISDDSLFHISDLVETKDIGTCFIIGFSEDLIHCIVTNGIEQKNNIDEMKVEVQINDIEAYEANLILGEIDESEKGDYEGVDEHEDHWPEPDSAIDEW